MSDVGEVLVRLKGDVSNLESALKRGEGSLKNTAGVSEESTRRMESAFSRVGAQIITFNQLADLMARGIRLAGAALENNLLRPLQQADDITKLARASGVAVRELSELRLAAELSGAGIGELAQSATFLGRRMAEAASGTGIARGIFKALDVEVKNADGTLRSTVSVLEEVADRFKELPDGPEKTAAAMAVFSRGGSGFINFLNLGSRGIRDLREEAVRAGIAFDERFGAAAEQVNDDIRRVQLQGEALRLTIASAMLPSIQGAATATLEWAQANRDVIGANVQEWVNNLTVAAKGAAPALSFVASTLGVIKEGIQGASRLAGFASTLTLEELLTGNISPEQSRVLDQALSPIQDGIKSGVKVTGDDILPESTVKEVTDRQKRMLATLAAAFKETTEDPTKAGARAEREAEQAFQSAMDAARARGDLLIERAEQAASLESERAAILEARGGMTFAERLEQAERLDAIERESLEAAIAARQGEVAAIEQAVAAGHELTEQDRIRVEALNLEIDGLTQMVDLLDESGRNARQLGREFINVGEIIDSQVADAIHGIATGTGEWRESGRRMGEAFIGELVRSTIKEKHFFDAKIEANLLNYLPGIGKQGGAATGENFIGGLLSKIPGLSSIFGPTGAGAASSAGTASIAPIGTAIPGGVDVPGIGTLTPEQAAASQQAAASGGTGLAASGGLSPTGALGGAAASAGIGLSVANLIGGTGGAVVGGAIGGAMFGAMVAGLAPPGPGEHGRIGEDGRRKIERAAPAARCDAGAGRKRAPRARAADDPHAELRHRGLFSAGAVPALGFRCRGRPQGPERNHRSVERAQERAHRCASPGGLRISRSSARARGRAGGDRRAGDRPLARRYPPAAARRRGSPVPASSEKQGVIQMAEAEETS